MGTYLVSNLPNKPKYRGFLPQEVEVNGKKAIYFGNGHLDIMSKKDFLEMMELAKHFYETEGVEEWIEKENSFNRWVGHPVLGTRIVNEKYILPEPKVEKREFRKNLKRNWGFNCPWCNTKVSSKTTNEYFRVHKTLVRSFTIEGTCCSKACSENLWYDLLIEWIRENKYDNVFHTDKSIR